MVKLRIIVCLIVKVRINIKVTDTVELCKIIGLIRVCTDMQR